ncbi:lysophospholipid acyltransferase family protein [Methylobrevis pamukkalensis]|uniref:DUF374 domain-containing protein n=1 Tax=Methylobrevis pamukkalensis TaxID=1439726 RepID=A0A1E3H7Z3_9HYPH|nr:lysophospholipid acyltransferase family protein [Methylobrevis pamukkalensis]ODN71621.1 hypothetical protein A6302_01042 [Methylobrevis pamukkalensis]
MGRRLKSLSRSGPVQTILGSLLAAYLRFVHATSRIVHFDPDLAQLVRPDHPSIVALWHGQHFMVPLVRPKDVPFAVLMAAHADAEMNAIAIHRLGLSTIRASGAHKSEDVRRKKGAQGFIQMLKALRDGTSIAMTADVPKGPAKIAGRGVILLARHSGRPILPLAYASSRRMNFDSWDKASFNLPFSRAAIVSEPAIFVPPETSDEGIEQFRQLLTDSLNAATRRAYQIVDHGA